MSHRSIGDSAELTAVLYLQKAWYAILQTNFTIPGGEIDIVAKDTDGTTVCVEVKYRSGNNFWSPEEALTPKKKEALYYTMLAYAEQKNTNIDDMRFDFIAIDETNGHENLRHYKNISLV